MKKNNKGMTLTELMVVLVIIAILSAITVPSFIKYIDNSKERECASNREAIILKYKTQQVLTPDLVLADYVATLDFGGNEKEFACPSGGTYSGESTGNQASIICSIHGGDLVLEGGSDTTPTATPTAFPLPSAEATPTETPNPTDSPMPEPTESPSPDSPIVVIPDESVNNPVSFEIIDYDKRLDEVFQINQYGGNLTNNNQSGKIGENPLEIFKIYDYGYYVSPHESLWVGPDDRNTMPSNSSNLVKVDTTCYYDYYECITKTNEGEMWNRDINKGCVLKQGNVYYVVIGDEIKKDTHSEWNSCPSSQWLFRRLPTPLP